VKLRQAGILHRTSLQTFAPGDVITIGPFTVEPYHVCHSIPDSVGLGITTPAGLIVHSGDFKFDHTPVDGWPTDYAKLGEFSGRGVLALLSDSTYSERPGTTPSEAMLTDVFDRVIGGAPGRVIVATFASLISRIQQVVDVSARHHRRLAIAGKTMAENVKMAIKLGYLHVPDGLLVTLAEIANLPARETVILATGTQGEPTAVLSRLAVGQHPSLHIQEGDTVLLSSHTIPGNEELIHRVINRLFQKGAEVCNEAVAPVHVSGHASQEEQKLLINMLQPRYFVPIHGELRHLKQHGKTARQVGIPEENIAVVENGYVLVLDDQLEIRERVPGGYVFVDGTRVGRIGAAVMREREELAQNGFLTVIVRYDRRTGQAVGRPRIVTRGFVHVPEEGELLNQAEETVLGALNVPPGTPPAEVENLLLATLGRFLYAETKSRPVIIPVVLEG